MKLLIKDVLLKNAVTDILVEGDKIAHIGTIEASGRFDKIVDGKHKAAIPGFINGHTHSAMTLFRGYADDMNLEAWLQEKIWPNEANLTEEMVYWGSRLACLEMIKSGTTMFHDMYWRLPATIQAVEDSGIRAVLSTVLMDSAGEKQGEALKAEAQQMIRQKRHPRIRLSVAPHAVYTVGAGLLQWAKTFADEHDILLHIHLSETKTEVENSKKNFGHTPVEYLHALGVLGSNTVAAHALWLTDRDVELLGAARAKVVHNPNSNLKLASGFRFRYNDLKKAGVLVGLGTDGCSSSNNLDMIEAMKTASLLCKAVHDDPTAMPVQETFDLATKNGAAIFDMPLGEIKEGNFADICLVDLRRPDLTPNHHFLSNLVYSSNGSCIDTVICDGAVVMENRKVKDEELILAKATEMAERLFYEKG